jgi:hypothetical protein
MEQQAYKFMFTDATTARDSFTKLARLVTYGKGPYKFVIDGQFEILRKYSFSLFF